MLSKELVNQLSNIILFKNISVDKINGIFDDLNYTLDSFESESIIKFSRDNLNKAYFLLQGTIRAEMQTYNGKILQVEKLSPPSLVAAGFMFSRQKTSPVNIIVDSKKALILALSYDSFLKLLEYDKTIMLNFLYFMANKLNFLSEKIRIVGLETLSQKVSSYLLSLYKKCGEDFILPITKEEMSNLFGATRPSVSRVFSNFEKEGIIKRISKNKIKILDCSKLRCKTIK